jgi:type VI protein secretion system component VasF
MSIEHPPYHGQARVIAYRHVPHASNVVRLHETAQARQADQLDEKLLAALSPLLDEVDGLRAKGAEAQDARNLRRLLEENARLRRLAVKLSNLLGDLPKQSA